MTWTVTRESGAVSFSNWLAKEAGAGIARQPPAFPAFLRPQHPVSLKRVAKEPDPFLTEAPSPQHGPLHGVALFLGQSMSVYEDLLNRLPMMIQVIDGEGVIQSVNRAAGDFLGYEPEALAGKHALSLHTEESRERLIKDVLPEFVRTGHFSNVDVKFVTRDGRIVDFLMSAIGYKNSQGKIERSIAVFADMSQRATALNALNRSEQRFRSAFEAAAQGMAVLTAEGRLETMNAALIEMLGFERTELASRRFIELLEPDDQGKAQALFNKLLAGGSEGLQAELRYRAQGDRQVCGLTSLSAVHGPSGRIEQFVVQIVDITSRQKAEAHLRQAQKMEAVGQLTGGIAHDFNNLLTIVIGNLQLIENTLKEHPKAEKRAREALNAATKGSQLTKQLLAFARRQPLDAQHLKVNHLIKGMEDILKRSVGETIDLAIHLMPGDPTILADATQLETSVLNLANNARDAMPEGGHLTIETAPVYLDEHYAANHDEVRPGHYIMIAVSDTGTGIPKHFLHKVFQPFFTTKEVGKGTGLGLSMVFGFIKQSGGHVVIYSEDNRGASIKMFLPRIFAPGEQPEADERHEPAEPRKAKILVVEDQEGVRLVATEFLTEFGYEVLEAENAVEALQMLQDHKDIDLLFTDVVMPGGMNGFDLSQAASLIRPDLKIIHASGYPRGAMVHQEEPRLKDNLISKPFQRDELRRIVEDTLAGKTRLSRAQ